MVVPVSMLIPVMVVGNLDVLSDPIASKVSTTLVSRGVPDNA
jgi:hypothetical protein